MRRLIRTLTTAALATTFAVVNPMRSKADEVDDFVNAQIAELHIPGLSMAVVKNGNLVRAKGYGFANVEHEVPALPETVYEIASLTKQFTACATLLLIEEGKLGLEDRIAVHLDA